ncbi:Photosystem I assembly protein Ycf3 [Arenibacter antarcticus]
MLIGYLGHAQVVDKKTQKSIKKATTYTWEGNKKLDENDFVNAEASYRKAISENTNNSIAPYNLGNAYYKNETYSEAFGRYKQAAENATDKADKHRAYHNMGNVFMKNREYQKAVDGYKEALRNDPTDEETRYNLALAKEMLKKQQEEQQNDQNKDEQDQKDKKDQEDQEDQNQDKKEGEQDQEDNKDKEEEKGDQGEEEKEDNKEGDGDKKDEKEKQPEKGDQQEQQQPRPNQLSPQQVKNLLDAMQNEEKKVQEKIDAQNIKGPKVKNEKDW